METINNTPSTQNMKLNKSFTKVQKILLYFAASTMGMFALSILIFGSNGAGAVSKSDMLEQIRQEKMDYTQTRITAEKRIQLEALLRLDAYEDVMVQVRNAEDPSVVDVEIEVNKLLGL